MKTKKNQPFSHVIHKYAGLDYISIEVPIKHSKHGSIIDVDPIQMDHAVARAITEKRLPLRGREVNFLRKVLGLSMDAFAHRLGLTSGSVFKWEKAVDQKLHLINEIAIRTLMAEELKLNLVGHFSKLISQASHAEKIHLKL